MKRGCTNWGGFVVLMYSANSVRSSTTFGLRGNVTSWRKRSSQKDGARGWRSRKSYRPDCVLSPPANRRREELSEPPAYSASFRASCYSPPTKSKRNHIIVSATVKQNQKWKRTSSRPLFVPLVPPSFLAPALVLTLSLIPAFLGLILAEAAPPWALGTFVCWSDFWRAMFVSVIFRRRFAGTHSSHLYRKELL